MFSIIVSWESYRGGNRDVTQCQRCLNFGHGTRNYFMSPRCASCGKSHSTNECPPNEGPAEAKCANCGGGHHGTDRKCPKREEFKQIRKQAATINQQNRKQRMPVFQEADFPALTSHQITTSNAPGTVPAWSVQKRLVQPPLELQHPPQTSNEPTELFSPSELMQIFTSMSAALRECRTKADQIQVLGSFIFQYGS